jgi:hypothetical protein
MKADPAPLSADCRSTAAPLAPPVGDVFDDGTAARWSWYFVVLGLVVRAVRYLMCFPLWQDEQLVSLNIALRDYAGLVRPLDLHQVAPVGYLISVKWLTETFGFNEYSLRAVALIGGCGGLILFRQLAAQLLRGTALVAAVAVVAVAYFPIRHTCEVKPYACDFFFAVLLLLPALAWFRNPTRLGPPVALGLVTIVALTFSFPAVFVAGGISLSMLPTVLRRREPRVFVAYAIYNLATLATFGGLLRLAVSDQFAAATQTDFMYEYWVGAFPPSWREFWRWPWWLVEVHTGEGLAYPVGSKRFGSIVSALLAVVGVAVMIRQRRTWLPGVTACVFSVAIVAAALGRYPYGHGERLQQYFAPFVCGLIGAGLGSVLTLSGRETVRRRATYGSFLLLLIMGLAWGVISQVWPYKNRGDRDHQAFSRWFWHDSASPTPTLCVTSDFGRPLTAVDRQKSFLVYQQINRRGGATARERLAAVPSGAELDCVAFELEMFPRSDQAVTEWLRAMQTQYRLIDERVYPITIDDRPPKKCAYRVWHWEPLSPESRPESAARFEPYPSE